MKISEPVEEAIAERLRAGDLDGAATVALKGYGPQILVYLRSILRDEDLSDDVFSHFSEKLWRSMRDFRGDARFGTFAYRMAWCALKDLERNRARRRETRLATDAVSRLVEAVRTATAPMLKTEARDRWAKIKDSLSPAERSLLLLRIERRLSWKDVAAIMAEEGEVVAEAALRKRLERLQEKLRALAKEQGLR